MENAKEIDKNQSPARTTPFSISKLFKLIINGHFLEAKEIISNTLTDHPNFSFKDIYSKTQTESNLLETILNTKNEDLISFCIRKGIFDSTVKLDIETKDTVPIRLVKNELPHAFKAFLAHVENRLAIDKKKNPAFFKDKNFKDILTHYCLLDKTDNDGNNLFLAIANTTSENIIAFAPWYLKNLKIFDIHKTNALKQNILHLLADKISNENKDYSINQLFLKFINLGADINAKDEQEYSPIDFLLYYDKDEMVKFLIENYSSVLDMEKTVLSLIDFSKHELLYKYIDANNLSTSNNAMFSKVVSLFLLEACKLKEDKCFNLLLKTRITNKRSLALAFAWAARTGNLAKIKALESKARKINTSELMDALFTGGAMQYAALNGDFRTIMALSDIAPSISDIFKKNIHTADIQGMSILAAAIIGGKITIVEHILNSLDPHNEINKAFYMDEENNPIKIAIDMIEQNQQKQKDYRILNTLLEHGVAIKSSYFSKMLSNYQENEHILPFKYIEQISEINDNNSNDFRENLENKQNSVIKNKQSEKQPSLF